MKLVNVNRTVRFYLHADGKSSRNAFGKRERKAEKRERGQGKKPRQAFVGHVN